MLRGKFQHCQNYSSHPLPAPKLPMMQKPASEDPIAHTLLRTDCLWLGPEDLNCPQIGF